MEKLIFSLVLLLTTKIIYLITGRNRRQIARIPKGMAILCQPPGRRYVAYAVGVFQLLFVAFFLVLYIKDGAPAEARQMWSLLVITSILICMLLIFSGNVAGRDCVYFNSREVRIEKPFRKSRTFQWEEIRKVDGNFDNAVNLYLLDGTKVLTARLGMVNYDVFCDMIKKTCPEKIASYYRSHMYEESQKCILRYGSEYYLLAAMGIGILLIYMATLVPAAAENSIIQQFLQGDFSQRFALLFAPVCGVISIVFLVVMLNTNIRYSQEKMTIKYPLHRKRELYWRNIQRIEMAAVKKTEKAEWMKLRLYTREGTYKISFKFLTHGKDEFLSMLFKMIQKYGISCMQTDKYTELRWRSERLSERKSVLWTSATHWRQFLRQPKPNSTKTASDTENCTASTITVRSKKKTVLITRFTVCRERKKSLRDILPDKINALWE